MEVLVLDGKNYVKASKAARDLGYATDYVGQLCRSGQVDSHLIGRTWYVNQEELSTHRVEKKRMSRVKAREYAKKTIEEYRKQNEKTENNYNSVAISYESDPETLIPETRKVNIISERSTKNFDKYSEEGDKKEVINKGKKVLMEGSLKVVDVTDGEIDESTTVLKPKIVDSLSNLEPLPRRRKDDLPMAIRGEEVVEELIEQAPPRKSFIERLEEENVAVSIKPRAEVEEDETPVKLGTPVFTQPISTPMVKNVEEEQISILTCVLITLIVAALSIATLPIKKEITYTKDSVGTITVTTGLLFNASEIISKIQTKI